LGDFFKGKKGRAVLRGVGEREKKKKQEEGKERGRT